MTRGPVEVDAFVSFTLAILLLFAGRELTRRITALRRYSIPEPVVGGVLCAAVVGVLDLAAGVRVSFELGARDMLLLYFFAAIGLKSDVRTLIDGGRPLLVLLVLACVFIGLQNGVGMAMAAAFGQDARAGLLLGSIALVGGFGTTLAWAPDFASRLGIAHALELGAAANMVGLVAACVIGGPVASHLMRRHRLQPSGAAEQDVGVANDAADPPLDYYGVLRAWLWLNVTLLLGQGLAAALRQAGLNLPDFVGCLLAGIALRNLLPLAWPKALARQWAGTRRGLALISDICLGMFLTMALMGLQPWALDGVLGFVAAVMAVQIVLAVAYILWVVFRCMGGDYEAAVVCAGFGGIALGSTSTAVANMSAVTRQHGAAHRAFIVVPLVCGFFVDVVNAFVIGWLAR
ncbi:sodium/glutamate symporter [Aquincola sp. MAHUQ-54]|uniref:Sodium/glutamate symporter n=1 Tax=Aquincola agrisoli TaxID=3119538 RepID=A0AAW9Q9B7_9BURK